ncbi:MAG TPA: MBL fold metallo-hydrolase, partial [Candidatus Riflebacteria bacterium]|nr:MBL fold metallo-hydrolase [Candidatus Riflebacteria bacterium]
GFEYMTGKKLVCHPGSFIRRFRSKKSAYIGLKFDQQFAQKNFELVLSAQPLKLSESVLFLGEIPRSNSFESKQTTFVREDGVPDFVVDDSALLIDAPEGLIIIVGCGHSGICNIINYARRLTGKSRIAAVVGGFHLKEDSPVVQPTIDYLLAADIGVLMPCHCVDASVLRFFNSIFNCEAVFAGKIKEF